MRRPAPPAGNPPTENEAPEMTINTSALLTAGLLAGLLLAGSLIPVHAGDACGEGNQGARIGSLSATHQASTAPGTAFTGDH